MCAKVCKSSFSLQIGVLSYPPYSFRFSVCVCVCAWVGVCARTSPQVLSPCGESSVCTSGVFSRCFSKQASPWTPLSLPPSDVPASLRWYSPARLLYTYCVCTCVCVRFCMPWAACCWQTFVCSIASLVDSHTVTSLRNNIKACMKLSN